MEIRKRLGSGGFAEVYEGVYRGKPAAIKKMKSSTKNPAATQEAFKAESRLQGLNHPNVIRLIAVEPELIILEFIPLAVNLQTLIDEDLNYPWRKYAQQLVRALSYLHTNNVLHLDLKPANVLVNQQHQCKVIDFGCSQPRFNPNHSACQGTLAYRAPELFKGHLPTTKADVYSLAVTLWSLKHQRVPYDGQQGDMIVYQVVAFHRRPSPDPEFQAMWTTDPLQRPEADELRF